MTTLSMVASDQPRCERMEKRADPTMMHTLRRDVIFVDVRIRGYKDMGIEYVMRI